MAIIKAVNSGASLKRAIDYISRDQSLPFSCMDGINCNAGTAFLEMCATKDLHHANKGTQYVHLVISLSPEESKDIDPARFLDECKKLINGNKVFYGFESVLAVHQDKDHLHCHVVSNSVSLETGKKTRWYRSHLRTLKQDLEMQVNEYNQEINQYNELHPETKKGLLHIPAKGDGKAVKGSTALLKIIEKGKAYKSWMIELAKKIADAKELATSQEHFTDILSKVGVAVKWDSRKTILFTDSDGNKSRNTKIDDAFHIGISKEELEHEFSANAELVMMKQFLKEVQSNGSELGMAKNGDADAGTGERAKAGDLETFLREIDADLENSRVGRANAENERRAREQEQKRLTARRREKEQRRSSEGARQQTSRAGQSQRRTRNRNNGIDGR